MIDVNEYQLMYLNRRLVIGILSMIIEGSSLRKVLRFRLKKYQLEDVSIGKSVFFPSDKHDRYFRVKYYFLKIEFSRSILTVNGLRSRLATVSLVVNRISDFSEYFSGCY